MIKSLFKVAVYSLAAYGAYDLNKRYRNANKKVDETEAAIDKMADEVAETVKSKA